MKFSFTLVILVLFSGSAFARMTEAQQMAEAQKVAKEHRRQLHIYRHEDVVSIVEKLTKIRLNELMEANPEVVDPLSREKISSLYRCLYSPKNCSLFLISLGYSMYGDSGSADVYLLLNPETGTSTQFLHEVYGE